MKLLATADLHLGAGASYGRQPHGPESRLADQESVWLRICELAVEEQVDMVLFAGDAFHRRRPSPPEILAYRTGLNELCRHGIPIVAIDGNHDVVSADLPSALSIFAGEIDLYRTPDIHVTDSVTVACLPWTPPGRLVAQRGGGDRDDIHRQAAEILVDVARGLRASCPTDRPAILMAHWTVSGGTLPTGIPTSELREPVIPLADLEAMGWDAVILGHIHRPQLLSPGIVFCGSLCTVDFGESATDHGVWLTQIERQSGSLTFIPIAGRPFVTHDVDFTDGEDFSQILEGYGHWDPDARNLDGAVVRVRYRCTAEEAKKVDHRAIERALYDAGAWRVYAIQPDIIREERSRVEGLTEEISPADALARWVETQGITPELAERVLSRGAGYLEQVES